METSVNNKCRAFTSLEQSRKLAEFLPIESADMYYSWHDEHYYIVNKDCPYPYSLKEKIPCWSLAALLSVIRKTIGYTIYGVNDVYISCELGDKPWQVETEVYDNEVDACYEMIIKLHELNLL